MHSIWLYENKWKDIESYLEQKSTILLPVGSVEQHAHHLPLGTDSLVAIKVAEDAAKKTKTLVAPPSWVGWAPHHMAFPGTITLRPETLIHLIQDMGQSLIYHGFKKLIIINGHREANLPPLKVAATKLRNHTGALVSIVDPFYIAEEIGRKIRRSEPGGVGHAAEMETSHMYHLYPELCEPSQALKNVHKKHSLLKHDPYDDGDRVFVPSDIASYREGALNIGVVGDPTVSNKENGEIYHRELVNRLVDWIQYCDEQDITLRNQSVPL